MKYARGTIRKDGDQERPVTANFAPPPSDGDKGSRPDKAQPSKEGEPAKHDKK